MTSLITSAGCVLCRIHPSSGLEELMLRSTKFRRGQLHFNGPKAFSFLRIYDSKDPNFPACESECKALKER
ncbi:hypothetical protein E4T56_gene7162 [Termitomyces sp. T112]|nr:hypothetical protein E4T56_gene7162 [Termitomyces sp. T112]